MAEREEPDCCFVWDEVTQLYFHASSGFYHDPNFGWYYSSSDGCYYKYDDGNYVLMNFEEFSECETRNCERTLTRVPTQKETCITDRSIDVKCYSLQPDASEAEQGITTASEEQSTGQTECCGKTSPEGLPRPSEWLEDTLIDLYLSNYNIAADTADGVTTLETNNYHESELTRDGNSDIYDLEEGEWIPEPEEPIPDPSQTMMDDGTTRDEEMWQAQYGEVVRSSEESVPDIPAVHLWDWDVVTSSRKDGKGLVARLVGRLVRQSAKLHPSMPSRGCLLKSAPICQVHLDLVRVTTGQVYKLRSPSGKYIASISTYDSSNPTSEWGFPELSVEFKINPLSNSRKHSGSLPRDDIGKEISMISDKHSASGEGINLTYRDRAAERRTLHGIFGVGPGQKNHEAGNGGDSSPVSSSTEDAAAEALNMSFGVGSYARRVLEGMGWKEGEALGDTFKGLKEPIQAVGNIGNSGLGWQQCRRSST